MKRILCTIALGTLLFVSGGCSKEDYMWDTDDSEANSGDTSGSGYSGESTATTGSLNFSIALDKSALEETIATDSNDDDYVENTTFSQTISIIFSTSGDASVSGDTGNIVKVSGNDVVATNSSDNAILFVLSGKTTDGFFKLYSDKKSGIKLNGVSIKNPDGAAINNQSKKRTFIVLGEGTENYITDGTEYADATDAEDMKAAFFSEGQLVFSGKGYLEVDANCKAGIRSDDYVRIMPGTNIWVDASSGNGIRGNEYVQITGGVINVNITGNANKGISTDGYVQVDGGRTTVTTSGLYEWDDDDNDYSACAGVKADSLFTMNGGELYLLSTGAGGKGISCDGESYFNGGTVKVSTTGSGFSQKSYSVSPKGIKSDGDLTVTDGTVLVKSSRSEGIESKGIILISGGTVASECYDDAINSKGNLTISGGYVFAHGTNNDGLDANQNCYLNGGVIVALGANGAEDGIDAAEGYSIFVNGGTIVAMGGSVAATSSSSKQASVASSASRNSTVGLFNGSTGILAFTVPSSAGGTALMISSPSLTSGKSYTLKSGVSVTGGSEFFGLTTGGTISGGSGSTSVTAAMSVGTSMGMGGGGFPGRW